MNPQELLEILQLLQNQQIQQAAAIGIAIKRCVQLCSKNNTNHIDAGNNAMPLCHFGLSNGEVNLDKRAKETSNRTSITPTLDLVTNDNDIPMNLCLKSCIGLTHNIGAGVTSRYSSQSLDQTTAVLDLSKSKPSVSPQNPPIGLKTMFFSRKSENGDSPSAALFSGSTSESKQPIHAQYQPLKNNVSTSGHISMRTHDGFHVSNKFNESSLSPKNSVSSSETILDAGNAKLTTDDLNSLPARDLLSSLPLPHSIKANIDSLANDSSTSSNIQLDTLSDISFLLSVLSRPEHNETIKNYLPIVGQTVSAVSNDSGIETVLQDPNPDVLAGIEVESSYQGDCIEFALQPTNSNTQVKDNIVPITSSTDNTLLKSLDGKNADMTAEFLAHKPVELKPMVNSHQLLSKDGDSQNEPPAQVSAIFTDHSAMEVSNEDENLPGLIVESLIDDEQTKIAQHGMGNGDEAAEGNIRRSKAKNSNKKQILRRIVHQKPYVQGNSFLTRKTPLKEHKFSQRGEKQYTCNMCNESFRWKSGLAIHVKIHKDGSKRPHVCKMCNKSFRLKYDLARHASVHTGERPYICKVCNKSFRLKVGLTNHVTIHSGESPHICNMCNMPFQKLISLKNHFKLHTSERVACTEKNLMSQ